MRVLRRLIVLAAAWALGSATAVAAAVDLAAETKRIEACESIETCLGLLRAEHDINLTGVFAKKFAAFGEPAVEPLVKLLSEPDPYTRHYAGAALAEMPRIDPKFLPALIVEDHRADNLAFREVGKPGWLAEQIGLVRDNPQALAYLFDLPTLDEGVQFHQETAYAIKRSSAAVWQAEARRRLEALKPGAGEYYLRFLMDLVRDPVSGAWPDWFVGALARVAADPAATADARETAEAYLRQFKHPLALAGLLRDARANFPALPPLDPRAPVLLRTRNGVGTDDWISGHIEAIADFGPAAHDAGPLLRPFLDRTDMPDSRAAAALALGLIGDRDAIPALIAAAGNGDDWLLVYNAVEALGRLHALEARARLTELSEHHWSEGVRINASRALYILRSGEWPPPGTHTLDEPVLNEKGNRAIQIGLTRYRGDEGGDGMFAECLIDSDSAVERAFSQSPIGAIAFPRHDAFRIVGRRVPEAALAELPWRKLDGLGAAVVIQPVSRGLLVGGHRGEFGSLLVYIADDTGKVTAVIPLYAENVELMFRHGGRYYVLTGNSNGIVTHGQIWQIDLTTGPPRVVRRMRLPADTRAIYATARHDLVFDTEDGAVILGEDGVLRVADDDATCKPKGAQPNEDQ